MGLFDKIKDAVQNKAEEFKNDYNEAAQMSLEELIEAMKGLSKLDPKCMSYRAAFTEKCNILSDSQMEELYAYVKKAGSLLKKHPAQDAVEDVLVRRKLYIRQEDGTIVKNSGFNLFKRK